VIRREIEGHNQRADDAGGGHQRRELLQSRTQASPAATRHGFLRPAVWQVLSTDLHCDTPNANE
jgi:hypothetical protein